MELWLERRYAAQEGSPYKADFASAHGSMTDHYRALGALVYVAVPPPVHPPGAFGINPDVNETARRVREASSIYLLGCQLRSAQPFQARSIVIGPGGTVGAGNRHA